MITDNFNIRQDMEHANVALDRLKMVTGREHEILAETAIHMLISVVAEMRNEIAQLQRVVQAQGERVDMLNRRTIGSMRLGTP